MTVGKKNQSLFIAEFAEDHITKNQKQKIAKEVMIGITNTQGGDDLKKWHWKDEAFVFILIATIIVELAVLYVITKYVR